MRVNLTKHHALGNDFLVLPLDQPLPRLAWSAIAERLCDRRRGVGADGLLLLGPARDGADASMALYNADGSEAEMSGNGIRCLAQAWARQEGRTGGTVTIVTRAGLRSVELLSVQGPRLQASVTMGPVTPIEEPDGWAALGCDAARPVAHLSLGNPHSVVAVDDVGAVDLVTLGAKVPQVNLEIVEPGPEPDAVTMRVHERGAGITEACGTGACAAAFAAAHWGLVDRGTTEITVHMDGGDAKVRLGDEAVLIGPATFVASVQAEL
ncbi:MAG TPA: diaminopimelate epimerase [Acidimicrobiales bacterium]